MKKLLTISAGIALTFAATATLANGLTLTAQNASANVAVQCNGLWSGRNYDVPKNGSIGPLPWLIVYGMFHGSTTLNCNFYLDDENAYPPTNPNDLIGSAQLTLNLMSGTAVASNVKYNPKYTVYILPGQNISTNTISVTLSPVA